MYDIFYLPLCIMTGFYEKENISGYCEYFSKNIQRKTVIEGEGVVFDGLSLEDFEKTWIEEGVKNMTQFQTFSELICKQEKGLNRIGVLLDIPQLYKLCVFINTIVRERLLILFRPTIKDTLSELAETHELSFGGCDGKKVTSRNTKLIDIVINALKSNAEADINYYEVERIVKIDEVANNIFMQSKFVFLLATFFKNYFPDAKRRKNCCLVSQKEQELILRILSFFNLAPKNYKLTESRYRQLIIYAKNMIPNENLITINGNYYQMDFIMYEDWSRKEFNWSSPHLQIRSIKEGDTISLINAIIPQI